MIIRLISSSPERRRYWFHLVKDFTKFRPNAADPSEGEIPILHIQGLNLTSPFPLAPSCLLEEGWNRQFPVWLFLLLSPPHPHEGGGDVIMFHPRQGLTPLSWGRFLYLKPPLGQMWKGRDATWAIPTRLGHVGGLEMLHFTPDTPLVVPQLWCCTCRLQDRCFIIYILFIQQQVWALMLLYKPHHYMVLDFFSELYKVYFANKRANRFFT